MDARARRRLALLSSHVNPLATTPFSSLSVSACACGDGVDSKEINNGRDDCVFCKIICGEAPAIKIYEDDECLCILDTYPLCHGHSLIIPKSHYPSLDATPPSIIGAMCSKVPLISNAVMKATGCDSFNLLVNNGAAAGQVIHHVSSNPFLSIYSQLFSKKTHIHIIPRKANDCLWTSESLRRRPMKLDQEVSRLADGIRESLMFVNSFGESKGEGSSLVVN